jgi:glycosyltransferase involved in cell wall biosynthesis
MTNPTHPLVTIAICTFNGERGIGACLESLNRQDYPRDRFSVIVVDDGCTDNTVAVAKKFGARVISHVRNLGVQHARNTALRAATGSILVYLDDDCVTGEQWLKELVAPFTDKRVVAVGGRVIAHKRDRLAERFMEATGYGNPELLVHVPGNVHNPLRRFGMYLANMYRPSTLVSKPTEAQAVYTANGAYRLTALRAIGGFDSSLRSNEDSDVATRLRLVGGKLVYAPGAVVSHRHHQRIWHVIRQTFYRAGDTYMYYKKSELMPPIFPFPFIYGTAVIGCSMLSLPVGLLALLTGPVLLYNSWIVHAIWARDFEHLVYAYVQCAREIASLLGFVRGALAVGQRRSIVGSYATRNAVPRVAPKH